MSSQASADSFEDIVKDYPTNSQDEILNVVSTTQEGFETSLNANRNSASTTSSNKSSNSLDQFSNRSYFLTNTQNGSGSSLSDSSSKKIKQNTTKKRKRGRPRKERTPLTEKKKWTSYTLFTSEWQPKVRKKYPDLSMKEVMLKVGSKWRSLPFRELYKYSDLAKKKNAEQKALIKEYLLNQNQIVQKENSKDLLS